MYFSVAMFKTIQIGSYSDKIFTCVSAWLSLDCAKLQVWCRSFFFFLQDADTAKIKVSVIGYKVQFLEWNLNHFKEEYRCNKDELIKTSKLKQYSMFLTLFLIYWTRKCFAVTSGVYWISHLSFKTKTQKKHNSPSWIRAVNIFGLSQALSAVDNAGFLFPLWKHSAAFLKGGTDGEVVWKLTPPVMPPLI